MVAEGRGDESAEDVQGVCLHEQDKVGNPDDDVGSDEGFGRPDLDQGLNPLYAKLDLVIAIETAVGDICILG